MQLTVNPPALTEDAFDVCIRFGEPPDARVIARRIAPNRRLLCAAPAYLARAGTPQTPDDLLQHECLVYTSGARAFDNWTLLRDGEASVVQVPSKIQINDGMALVAAACAGGGILAIDQLLVDEELARGTLVRVLPEYSPRPGQPIYAVYPARTWLAFKTATFIAFLQQRLWVRP